MKKIVSLLFIALALPQIAFAWGGQGHSTIAHIAERHLTAKAKANAQNIFLWRFMSQQADRSLTAENVDKFVSSLNAFGATTSTGLPYTPLRFRAMWTKVQSLYVS